MSEPGNVLHPDEYAKDKFIKKFGLKVNVYDEKKLKKLGMNTLPELVKEVSEDHIL